MTLAPKELLIGGTFVAVALGWLLYAGWEFAEEVEEFVTDPNNPINQTAVGLWQVSTGSESSPGADLYEATHGEDGKANWLGSFLDVLTGAPKPAVINPAP